MGKKQENKKIIISVILASYNGEKYIREQMESVAGQTREADEVLIVDDHSSDKTAELARQFVQERDLVNWKVSVRPENLGYAHNFIEGIHRLSGDIILFCDQDDIWHRDKIAKMEQWFQHNSEIDLLLSDCQYFYENMEKKQVNRTKELCYNKNNGKIRRRNNWPCIKGLGCTFAFRRRLIPVVNALWAPGYPHDLCVWHAAAIRDGIYLINEKLIDYRRHGNNVSGHFSRSTGFRTDSIYKHIGYLKRIKEYIASSGKGSSAVGLKEVNQQIEFYIKRKKYLEERDWILWMRMLGSLSYYDRKRNWVSDFLCMLKG